MNQDDNKNTVTEENQTPIINVAPSPHLVGSAGSTQQMMLDVLIALIPVVASSIYFFRVYAIKQLLICIAGCMITEAVFTRMRGKSMPLSDLSALVTGVILGLSLPGTAPWYIPLIASVTAIGIGKTVFGGIGMNIFNPAMVGRAFVMIAFSAALAASGYETASSGISILTKATPLTAFQQSDIITPLSTLFWGAYNGSLGETNALACILGGLYLCIRRTASWEIPAGMIGIAILMGSLSSFSNVESGWTPLHHLFGGALLFGAFFIATDPVTSPLTPKGKLIFGAGVGFITMVLRLFSGYPEGVMFAVLFMNALTPLINRWTIPRPLGKA
ncbi:MAG: RnfABCDGE type electron transport complex subunit D [Proteobacteria bacterium]|nr:RnfABCDGE type electron transport complex subunit D [Pseudomonadota bacterium]MBU4470447.1 RnfABCDGE type electron transport complex subunit D [Pseudomonadota bacterium]MCG2753500.1 RnfABCDGE type electron transport complex subunit D [Desulfobacteraceae bacterium]